MKLNKQFIIQKTAKKITLFDGEKSTLYKLNETASYIFESIKNGKKNDEIIKNMCIKFGAKPEAARKDFEELIGELKKRKILS